MSNNVSFEPLEYKPFGQAVKDFFKKPSFASFKTIFRRKPSLDRRKARAGYLFVAPFLVGIILIYLPLLIDSVWFSFSKFVYYTEKVETSPGVIESFQRITTESVGFEYYVKAFQNQEFYQALLASVQQMLFEVPAIIIFSLFIAVVLNQKMLGRAAFRAIFFVPVIISTGVMASINAGDMMMQAQQNGINDGSAAEGGGAGIISELDLQAVFANMQIGTELVGYVVGLVNDIYNIINYSGVQMLIFLAGLQSISPSIYEACQIEGATGWETFWKVTFPMISPMILVNAVYTVIDAFTRTDSPATEMARAVGGGLGGAMSWIYFLIVAVILALVGLIASSFVFYQRRD